jgi:hypothetical protein
VGRCWFRLAVDGTADSTDHLPLASLFGVVSTPGRGEGSAR